MEPALTKKRAVAGSDRRTRDCRGRGDEDVNETTGDPVLGEASLGS